jgi:hypothetical protein
MAEIQALSRDFESDSKYEPGFPGMLINENDIAILLLTRIRI